MKDVCPSTRLRCSTAEMCAMFHCARDRGLRPVDDRNLTKAEQYALAMADQKAAASKEGGQ